MVKVSDRGWPCLEFEPGTTKDPPWLIGSPVGRNQTTVMWICDRWMQEGKTNRRGRSHSPQCTTSPEWSVRKTSIAWSTLDAEPQTSPPPMVQQKKDVGGIME
ncbi:uncharacterized protein TNCV_3011731 [Trichonephila clavipes]|nr:uncharacterized protein TNCV_3011731 [Trichonephila clavipes]